MTWVVNHDDEEHRFEKYYELTSFIARKVRKNKPAIVMWVPAPPVPPKEPLIQGPIYVTYDESGTTDGVFDGRGKPIEYVHLPAPDHIDENGKFHIEPIEQEEEE